MAKRNIISTNWYRFNKLLVTEISGDISMEDVENWERCFLRELQKIEDNTEFKILINLSGFKALNFEVHKRFRSVVPATLANYGWRVGYLNVFEEANELPLKRTRGIECLAAAHVHQDASKMETYESAFGKYNEHFFTDINEAFAWVRAFNIQPLSACS